MKKNKLVMFAFLVFMISITHGIAMAQENSNDKMKEIMKNTTPAERADFQTNFMAEELKLTDPQVEPIRAVNLKYAKKGEKIYNSQESKFKKFRKMQKMQNDKDTELKSILTDEQYEAYEQKKEEMRDKMKDKHYKQSQNNLLPQSLRWGYILSPRNTTVCLRL